MGNRECVSLVCLQSMGFFEQETPSSWFTFTKKPRKDGARGGKKKKGPNGLSQATKLVEGGEAHPVIGTSKRGRK